MKFPKLIHVRIVPEGNGNEYLTIEEGGVTAIDQNGEPIAIYQLVEQGVVSVQRAFVSRKAKAKRGRARK